MEISRCFSIVDYTVDRYHHEQLRLASVTCVATTVLLETRSTK